MRQTIKNLATLFLRLTLVLGSCQELTLAKDYYYTRTRENPYHLRVSEEFKNNYINEVKYESKINGTKYEYYKSSLSMSHDELVFEAIDKIFRHRLSPFYIHHYDNGEDKRKSSDPEIVSQEACARDLMYLVDKLPKASNPRDPYTNNGEDHMSPELTAFFDSYAKQEAGILMGNTYWVGAYDQCINRHIFELTGSHKPDLTRPLDEQDQQVISFKGRYCVSSLKSSTWDASISAKKVNAKNYFKSERQFDDYSKLFRLQVGICLPSSCDSSAYDRHTDEIKLLTTSMLDQRYADYELIDLYCLPDESSPLRAWSSSALYFLAFVACWTLILFIATTLDLFGFVDTLDLMKVPQAHDKRVKQSRLRNFVLWFSLRANYQKLMKVNLSEEDGDKIKPKASDGELDAVERTVEKLERQQSANEDVKETVEKERTDANREKTADAPATRDFSVNLRFLNAFKVMIMFWIINGHIMLLMIQTAKNILNSDALLNGLMHFLIGATFGVDLFFTMTGFLTSYLIFNSGHAYKMRLGTWIYLTFHRYWRLAPLYLITFWFSKSVVQSLGSGPLWDYGTSSLTFRGLCNHESWWYPLTLTSNLHGLFDECIITSWYISCDMQFWLVSPIFIHLLAKKPKHGWVAAISVIIMSCKFRYDSILSDTSARHDELVQPRADIFMRVSHDLPALYTHPHYRIAAYIVGLLAGHYVYMVKSGKWRSSIVGNYQKREATINSSSSKSSNGTRLSLNWSRNMLAFMGLLLFSLMAFISYLLANFYPTSLLKYAKLVAAFAYSVDHLAMSIGASFIIIAMCYGQWPRLVNFLSHPNWTRLSKMNYALLLLQCEAIYFQIFRYDSVPVAGTKELINILFNILVSLYPMAFLVTLAFEYPLANLEKLLQGGNNFSSK